MENKNQEKLDTIYEGLLNRLEKIENFTIEQAPDVCKEIVAVKIMENYYKLIINGLFSFIALIIDGLLSYGLYYGLVNDKGGVALGFGIGLFIIGSFTLAIITDTITPFLRIKEIEVSKKLVIMKELRRLIK